MEYSEPEDSISGHRSVGVISSRLCRYGVNPINSRRSAPGVCALFSSGGVAQLNSDILLISSTFQLATAMARPEMRHANGYNNSRKAAITPQSICELQQSQLRNQIEGLCGLEGRY